MVISAVPVFAMETSAVTTSDGFVYTVSNGEVTITDYTGKSSDELEIPEYIGGYPVTAVGNYAFSDYTFSKITIHPTLRSVGTYGFGSQYGCNVYIEDLSAWCGISFENTYNNPLQPNGMLYLNGSLVEDLVIPYGVTEIGPCTFSFCKSIKSVSIPNSVKSIGEDAFYNCPNIKSVTIGNSVEIIDRSAFSWCTSLESVSLPSNLKSLGVYAFCHCESLESISLPAGLESIADDAFNSCTKIESINIPASTTVIGSGIIGNCNSLTSVTVDDANPVYHDSGNCIINTADKVLVSGCNISVISADASVTSIGYKAFYMCESLANVNIPESVTSIGEYAFYGCKGLSTVYYDASEAEWNSILVGDRNSPLLSAQIVFSEEDDLLPEGLEYEIIDGEVTITDYTGSAAELVIPSTIDGYPVTSIGNWAFYDCSSLESITIPEGVASIGHYAFHKCASLESITLPASITSIEDATFYECPSLTSVTIPDSVTSIGPSAFCGCTNLSAVSIPESVTSICESAFYECANLSTVYYDSNEDDWNNIAVEVGNDDLLSARIVYGKVNPPFEYEIVDGSVTITGYTGEDSNVVIPTLLRAVPSLQSATMPFTSAQFLKVLFFPKA